MSMSGDKLTFEISFTKGSEVFSYLSLLKAELSAAIEAGNRELALYKTFCFRSVLSAYTKLILEKFGVSLFSLEEDLLEFAKSSDEGYLFTCHINSKTYSTRSYSKDEYSFDKDALKSKGLTLRDGSAVKDMTGYVKYLRETGKELPNFISEKTKTICSFDKVLAEASHGSDDLVKKTVKTTIELD